MKDLFSNHAEDYKRYRPTYPDELFDYLAQLVKSHYAAWDCGTGNGQGAMGLSPHFKHIYATDLSKEQLDQAEQAPDIIYQVATAENSGLPDESVSLITVFQAFHWFDFDAFYQEAKRVLKPDGILAIIGYNTAITGIETVDNTYKDFCFDYLWEKNCWAFERKTLNSNYNDIVFPFEPMETPEFFIQMQWNYFDYLNYLNTWSAVKAFQKRFGSNPVEGFVIPKIENAWPDKTTPRLVKFPLILKMGKMS